MAFKFLQQFFSSGHIGVDLGASSIKAVELSRQKNVLHLKNYGILESYGHNTRFGGVLQGTTMKAIDSDIVELLKILIGRMKTSARRVTASIPNLSGFMTLLELPQMSEKELVSAIGFQAREHVPLPIEDVLLDWVPIGVVHTDGIAKQQVLLVATPLELIENYKMIFQKAGLTLTAIELDSIALARSVCTSDPTATALVDIGSRATVVSIVRSGMVLMTFNSQAAGGDITQAITKSLRVGSRRAEELKKMRGLKSASGEEELANLMLPLIDSIVGEVRRAIRIYEEQYKTKIERIMLAGGTANLPGIAPYIRSLVNLPVVNAFPFNAISYASDLEPVIREIGPILGVATGCAIKDLSV